MPVASHPIKLHSLAARRSAIGLLCSRLLCDYQATTHTFFYGDGRLGIGIFFLKREVRRPIFR